MNERVRARIQRAVADRLEPGETVELAVLAHSGPMFYDPIMSMFNMINAARGRTQGRALILTDRRVLYMRTSILGSIRGLIGAWPRGSAPIEVVEEKGRGRFTVDGESATFRGLAEISRELVREGRG
jgi:hypothetical protein